MPAQDRRLGREGPEGAADLERLLVVRLGLRVAVAVVVPRVDVAVVLGEVVVERHAVVRRGQEPFAFGERRALEAVPVDALRVVDEGRLLEAEADPRSLRHPVVQVELGERVLQAKHVAAAQAGSRSQVREVLTRDVGRDAERHDVADVPGDVDVGPSHVEAVRVNRVAVGVLRRGVLVIGVIGEDCRANLDRWGVVRWGISGRCRHLRPGQRRKQHARRRRAPHFHESKIQAALLGVRASSASAGEI